MEDKKGKQKESSLIEVVKPCQFIKYDSKAHQSKKEAYCLHAKRINKGSTKK